MVFNWTSLVAQMVKCLPAMRETWVRSLGREDPLEKEMATHSSTNAWKIPWTEEACRLQSTGSQRVWHDWATSLHFISLHQDKKIQITKIMKERSFPGGSVGRESTCNAGDPSSTPGWGRSPGEGNGNPLQYSCLKNPKDRGAWWAMVHRVAKSQTQLSN